MNDSSNQALNDSSSMRDNMRATVAVRLFGATSYAILYFISLFLNLILLIILLKGHKEYKKHTFYIIVWQHLMCDIIDILAQIIIVVPLTFVDYNVYGSTIVINIIGFFETFSYYGVVHFAFLMTINRFSVFLMPKFNRLLFDGAKTYGTVLFTWIYVLCFALGSDLIRGCKKNFFLEGYYLFHDCVSNSTDIGLTVWTFRSSCITYFPVVMLIAYVSIYLYVKVLRGKDLSSNFKQRDYALLIQCFLICMTLEIENLSFTFISKIEISGQLAYFVSFLQNWIVILNNTINPIVLFIFNSEIRRSLKNLYGSIVKNCLSTQTQPTIVLTASESQNNRRNISVVKPGN